MGVTTEPTAFGPLTAEGVAQTAARALDGHESDDVEAAIPPLRARLRRLARDQRFEDAARLRDRLAALGERSPRCASSGGSAGSAPASSSRPGGRASSARTRSPAGGWRRSASFPQGAGGLVEVRRCSRRRSAPRTRAPEDADELRLVASFLRRPPPELRSRRSRRTPFARRGRATLGRVTSDAAGAPTTSFADRLAEAVERKRSQLVVGLDPVIDLLPVELVARRRAATSGGERRRAVLQGIVDAVAPYVVAVKPQAAFFEALGSDGWRAFETVSAYAREAGLLVIADGKRCDIGSTARAYAAAFLEPRGAEPPLADALTVSPYLGRDSIDPFLAAVAATAPGCSSSSARRTPGGRAAGRDALGRSPRLAPRRRARRHLGRGPRRRAALERRRGRRRDCPAHRR